MALYHIVHHLRPMPHRARFMSLVISSVEPGHACAVVGLPRDTDALRDLLEPHVKVSCCNIAPGCMVPSYTMHHSSHDTACLDRHACQRTPHRVHGLFGGRQVNPSPVPSGAYDDLYGQCDLRVLRDRRQHSSLCINQYGARFSS